MSKPELLQEPEPTPSMRKIEVREVLQVFLERWWIIVTVSFLAAGLGYFYAIHRIPVYQAQAVLQVEQEDQKWVGINDVTYQDLRASEVLNTIVANIKNSAVLRRVVRTNNLAVNPSFKPAGTNMLTEEQAMTLLGLKVRCELRKETRLIDIVVADAVPVTAQQLANSMAQEFIRQNLDQRFSTARLANELLYEDAAKLKEKLAKAEQELHAYKAEKETVALEDPQNIVMDKVKEFNKSLSDAKAARLALEADLKQVQALSNRVEALVGLPGIISDPAVADLRQKVIALDAQVQSLGLRYKSKHPKMIQAQRELQDLRDALNKTVLSSANAIKTGHERAVAREKQLEQALQQAQQDALNLDQNAIRYHELLREVQSDRALYDSILRRLKETDLTKVLERQSISIVEPAALPIYPVGASAKLIAALAGLAGFMAILGCFYLRRRLNDSIHAVDEAEAVLGVPVLAAITKARQLKGKNSALIMLHYPDSPCAEAFRTLRTSVQLMDDNEAKVILFTSAVPSEGKSFCSTNFALSLAQEGYRTLLIDCDLHRPTLWENLGIAAETPGLGQYLAGRGTLAEAIHETEYSKLFLVPAGAPVDNPSEALSWDRIHKLLAEAEKQFDRIVLDSPPIHAVSDTFRLLPAVQRTFLVLRAGSTLRRVAGRALELMVRARHPAFGIILNFLPENAGYGYYYHYSQDYRYQGRKAAQPAPLPLVQNTGS